LVHPEGRQGLHRLSGQKSKSVGLQRLAQGRGPHHKPEAAWSERAGHGPRRLLDLRARSRRDRHARAGVGELESDPPPDPERLRAETRERIGSWNELGRRLCRSFLASAERLAR